MDNPSTKPAKGTWKWDEESQSLILVAGPKIAKEVSAPVVYTGQYL